MEGDEELALPSRPAEEEQEAAAATGPPVSAIQQQNPSIPSNLKILQHNTSDGYHVLATEQQTCSYYIKRKSRGCRRRAADGSRFCSLHEPGALEAERVRCRLPADAPAAAVSSTAPPSTATDTDDAATAAAKDLEALCSVADDDAQAETEGTGKKKARISGWRRRRRAAAATAAAAAAEGGLLQEGEAGGAAPSSVAPAATGRVSSTSRRMRNPFSVIGTNGAGQSEPPKMPDWGSVLTDPSLPTLLDIGSARGLFVEQMAAAFPRCNYIGVEIREAFVDEALSRTAKQRTQGQCCNLAFMAGNVLEGSTMGDILVSLKGAGVAVSMVTVQFPDPWVSPKHRKRRTVSPGVARALSEHLVPGARVYVSSDVPAVLWDAAETLRSFGKALRRHCRPGTPDQQEQPRCGGGGGHGDGVGASDTDGAAPREGGGDPDGRPKRDDESPFGGVEDPFTDQDGQLLACPVGGGKVFSERDRVCEELWRRVYRVMFTKTDEEGSSGDGDASEAASSALAGYAADVASSGDGELELWTDADQGDQEDH